MKQQNKIDSKDNNNNNSSQNDNKKRNKRKRKQRSMISEDFKMNPIIDDFKKIATEIQIEDDNDDIIQQVDDELDLNLTGRNKRSRLNSNIRKENDIIEDELDQQYDVNDTDDELCDKMNQLNLFNSDTFIIKQLSLFDLCKCNFTIKVTVLLFAIVKICQIFNLILWIVSLKIN